MSSRITRIAFDAPALSAQTIAEVCSANGREQESERPRLGSIRLRFCADEELAEQLRCGNGDALTEIFRRHSQMVFAIAKRILRSDAEAEDAAQQVFLDVYRSIGQYDAAKGEFKTWLMMFVYHRTFNRRRKLTASQTVECDELDECLPGVAVVTPAFGLTCPERRILIAQAMSALTERQRRTIELTYYGGLTADEIAARTGETVRVVRHNLYRGLERVRRFLCKPADGGKR